MQSASHFVHHLCACLQPCAGAGVCNGEALPCTCFVGYVGRRCDCGFEKAPDGSCAPGATACNKGDTLTKKPLHVVVETEGECLKDGDVAVCGGGTRSANKTCVNECDGLEACAHSRRIAVQCSDVYLPVSDERQSSTTLHFAQRQLAQVHMQASGKSATRCEFVPCLCCSCQHGIHRLRRCAPRDYRRSVLVYADGMCDGDLAPEERACADTPCESAKWAVSDWGECSEKCGGKGYQTCDVKCLSSTTGAPVGFARCPADAQPPATQLCEGSPAACAAPRLEYGAWGACVDAATQAAVTCGDSGMQARAATCYSSGSTVDASGAACAQLVSESLTRPCNRVKCAADTAAWVSGEWGAPVDAAGDVVATGVGGTAAREVTCTCAALALSWPP
jgi:Thrombospondin type 1 domain